MSVGDLRHIKCLKEKYRSISRLYEMEMLLDHNKTFAWKAERASSWFTVSTGVTLVSWQAAAKQLAGPKASRH